MKINTAKIYLSVAGVAIIVVLLITASVFLRKTDHNDTDMLINKIFLDFESKEWRSRDAAVTELKRNETLLENKKVEQQLIKVFQNEVEIEKQRKKSFYLRDEQPEPDGEGYGEYYIELLVLAGKLKNPNTIPFLVNSLEFGRGVAESLTELGDTALPFLLKKCENGSEDERWWCFGALPKFYKRTVSSEFKTEIKTILTNALQEKNKRINERASEKLKELE